MRDFSPYEPPADQHREETVRLMIGKVANLYNITVQTLRHYDKIGLFCPEVINPDTGYRYYSLRQLRQLEYILFLRQLHLTLPEIQEAMEGLKNGGTLETVLNRRDAALSAEIEQLQSIRETIHALQKLKQSMTRRLGSVVIQEYAPARRFLLRQIFPLKPTDARFSLTLMEQRKELLGEIPSIQTSYGFGAVASLANFRRTGAVAYTGILLDPGLYGVALPPGMTEFPADYYASICFNRNEMQPELAYEMLSDFLERHYFASDDTILELEQDPSFSSISRVSELTELQVRVALE